MYNGDEIGAAIHELQSRCHRKIILMIGDIIQLYMAFILKLFIHFVPLVISVTTPQSFAAISPNRGDSKAELKLTHNLPFFKFLKKR